MRERFIALYCDSEKNGPGVLDTDCMRFCSFVSLTSAADMAARWNLRQLPYDSVVWQDVTLTVTP